MPTELEELVGFIANPNAQIRLLAAENLVPYSLTEPNVFKVEKLQPIKHLSFLVRDHPKIAEHAITMLVNLSSDKEVLEVLATDEKFLGIVFDLIVNPEETNANLLAMLVANLSKWDGLKDFLKRKQEPPKELGSDEVVLNQLLDLFVKGQDGTYNKKADFDYLAYVFADLSKHADIRNHFLQEQSYDKVIPLNKIKVFTEHKSDIRRKGVASTIKNLAFEVSSHPAFLSEDEIDILPYILLPIMGNEEYDDDDSMDMLPDLQLLPPDKKRDSDNQNVQTHVETLTLLTSSREGRDLMRRVKVYPVIRETHLRVNDEGVQEACERLVQVLARDEEGEGESKEENGIKAIEGKPEAANGRVEEVVEDEDDQLVEV
ncbi:related to FAM203 family protein C1020.12c [Fusarium torulosum]|uniref:Protein HGH1 homolog n=1 Tax=Fusarium torulosum TaxID=33205 RepID=A0AAE8MF15_9HYPO|nr:related to FAM203 family protein C1020.12c [Fusarium torulosum]